MRWCFSNQLSCAAQNMFLDCVSVMHQAPEEVVRVWEAWWPGQAYTAFNRLKQLSLVSVKRGKLVVLDVIRWICQSMLLEAASSAAGPAAVYAGSRIWLGPDGTVQGAVQVRKCLCVQPATAHVYSHAKCYGLETVSITRAGPHFELPAFCP